MPYCKICGKEIPEGMSVCEECAKRESFEVKGRKYWEGFGKSLELLPRLYFDFVSEKEYKKLLKDRDLRGKKVIDLGAGYPPPPKESPEKKLVPLASELQEILEKKGAKLIAVDVAEDPLEHQKKRGRETILASVFQLPFKDESIDGGAVILNLFNSSFKGEGGKEVYITLKECEKILREVYRVLQKGSFVIISNWGYAISTIDNLIKISGPEENEIITPEMIQKLAEKIGFKNVKDIPLEEKRIELGKKLMLESFPEALRERITVELKAPGALFMEK